MKKAAKILIIIGMIGGCVAIVSILAVCFALKEKFLIIIGMIYGCMAIVPIVVGYFALKKMKTGKPSTGFSVCVLLFCSLLGGVFLLCSKDEEYIAQQNA